MNELRKSVGQDISRGTSEILGCMSNEKGRMLGLIADQMADMTFLYRFGKMAATPLDRHIFQKI